MDEQSTAADSAASQYAGTCHCGACCIELTWPGGEPIPARRCLCSFCQRHGAIWTSHPDAKLLIDSNGPTQRYRFGTATADFLLCSKCGVSMVALSQIEGQTYAVVNLNCLQPSIPTESPQDNDLDDEDLSSRLKRRSERWIADVSFSR